MIAVQSDAELGVTWDAALPGNGSSRRIGR